MATIGDLVIELRAETAQLRADMQKATGQVRDSSRRMERSLKGTETQVASLVRAFRLLAGAAVVGFAVRSFNEMVDAQDRAAKASRRLGIAVDQLTALHFAAQQAGVSVQTLEMALQRMIRRVAEARQGKGEAVGALAELGLSPEGLAGLSAADRLNAVADALAGVRDEADQVRLAMKLFDSEGVALLQMLKGGSAQIEAWKQRAKELGVVIDRDATGPAERWKDQVGELDAAWTGLFRTIAEPALPKLTEWAKNSTEALTALTAAVNGQEGAWERYFARISIIPSGPESVRDFQRQMGLLPPRGGGRHLPTQDPTLAGRGGAGGGAEQERRQVAQATETLQQYRAAEIRASHATMERMAAILAADRALREHQATVLSFMGEQGAVPAEGVKIIEHMQVATEELGYAVLGTADTMTYLNDEYERVRVNTESFASVVSSSFAHMITSGQSAGDMLRNLATQLTAMIIQAGAFKAIMGAFGFAAAPVVPVPGANPFPGNTRGLQHGGHASAGRPYLVGERGPELMVPDSAGTVVPNGALGGPTVVLNIDARGAGVGARAELEAAATQLERRFARLAVEVGTQARRRGFGG